MNGSLFVLIGLLALGSGVVGLLSFLVLDRWGFFDFEAKRAHANARMSGEVLEKANDAAFLSAATTFVRDYFAGVPKETGTPRRQATTDWSNLNRLLLWSAALLVTHAGSRWLSTKRTRRKAASASRSTPLVADIVQLYSAPQLEGSRTLLLQTAELLGKSYETSEIRALGEAHASPRTVTQRMMLIEGPSESRHSGEALAVT